MVNFKLEFVYNKAKERLKISDISFKEKCYYASASNLYYALFHFMHSVLGSPKKGKWEHIGIAKEFHRYCYENKIFTDGELNRMRKSYEDMYSLRRISDYKEIMFDDYDIEILKEYINFFKGVFKYVS